jgi:hypothetical protein
MVFLVIGLENAGKCSAELVNAKIPFCTIPSSSLLALAAAFFRSLIR